MAITTKLLVGGSAMDQPLRIPLLVLFALRAAPLLAQSADVIRGKVSTETGAPLAGASVLVIQSSDQKFRATNSDSAGRFQLVWPGGTGAYTVRCAGASRLRYPGSPDAGGQCHRGQRDAAGGGGHARPDHRARRGAQARSLASQRRR